MINQSVDQAGSTLSRRRSQARTWSGVGLIALGLFMPIQKETCVSFIGVSGCYPDEVDNFISITVLTRPESPPLPV